MTSSHGSRTKVFSIPEIIKMYNDMQDGKEIPVSPRTIYNRMKEHDISSRNDGSYARLDWRTGENNVFNVLKDLSYDELENGDFDYLISLDNMDDYTDGILGGIHDEWDYLSFNESNLPKGLLKIYEGMIEIRDSKESVIKRIKAIIESHGLQEHFIYKD